jgi:hypothetical protein
MVKIKADNEKTSLGIISMLTGALIFLLQFCEFLNLGWAVWAFGFIALVSGSLAFRYEGNLMGFSGLLLCIDGLLSQIPLIASNSLLGR